MSAFEGRACGKVVLLGEHAVVYGVPGIAAGIDRGAVAVARRGAGGPRLSLDETTVLPSQHGASDLAKAFAALLDAHPDPVAPLSVDAHAELPPGGGLGCSAALGVAIARAVERAEGRDDEQIVRTRALAWERVFHGNPSGIDTAAAMQGGALWFERERGARPLEVRRSLWLAIGNSGRGASTREMVERVRAMKQSEPARVQSFLDLAHELVDGARSALSEGDGATLGALMSRNQDALRSMSLSTSAIDRMCELAEKLGALGVKLTGSGGGGSVIALAGMSDEPADTRAEALARSLASAWTERGFPSFVTKISHRGGST